MTDFNAVEFRKAVREAARLRADHKKDVVEARKSNGAFRNYLKEQKRRNIDPDRILQAIDDMEIGREGMEEEFRQRIENQAALGVEVRPIQADMFRDTLKDGASDQQQKNFLAEMHGQQAGERGDARTDSNPYKPGSEEYAVFDRNWVKGDEARRLAGGGVKASTRRERNDEPATTTTKAAEPAAKPAADAKAKTTAAKPAAGAKPPAAAKIAAAKKPLPDNLKIDTAADIKKVLDADAQVAGQA